MKRTAMTGWPHLANRMSRLVIATHTLPIWSTGAQNRVLNVSMFAKCVIQGRTFMHLQGKLGFHFF